MIDEGQNRTPQPWTRRQFLRGIGRACAAAALAAVVGVLAARRIVSDDRRCDDQPTCGGCGLFDDCGLPRAIAARSQRETT